MQWKDLFKDGSLKFISGFIEKIVYNGLGAEATPINQGIVILVSTLITVFLLYKLAWLVWKVMKFIISCWEW